MDVGLFVAAIGTPGVPGTIRQLRRHHSSAPPL